MALGQGNSAVDSSVTRPEDIMREGAVAGGHLVQVRQEGRTAKGGGRSFRNTRSRPHLHIHRRAPEANHADGDSQAYPANQCVFKEMGEPLGRAVPVLRLVRTGAHSPHSARHPGHGSGNLGSRVGVEGTAGVDRSLCDKVSVVEGGTKSLTFRLLFAILSICPVVPR